MKKIFALLLALIMVMGLATTAFAATDPSITIKPNNDSEDTQSLVIDYTWYKILEASIETDAVVDENGTITTPGTVAYYVTNADRVAELTETGLFTITQVTGSQKWYVELKNDGTTAEQIIAAISASTFDLSKFDKGTFKKESGADSANSGTLTPGYYYIQSSLGTKIAVQTLSAVTIKEKNTYPTMTKTHNTEQDTLAGIGDTVTYTIKVEIPESVAEKPIVIVDTLTKGLTLNTAVTVTGAADGYNAGAFVKNETYTATAGESQYKLTIPAANVIANKGKTLTFTYTATINENVAVLVDEENKAHIEYDNYVSVDTEPVKTKPLAFTLEKVDGADYDKDSKVITQLTGAEFSLWTAKTGGEQIKLVLKDEAKNIYRVATAEEAAAEGFVSAPVKAGQATIEGLNDQKYYLQEDKAPTGYNKLTERVEVEVTAEIANVGVDTYVKNNKGTTLPSTGGMGTTLFYAIGGLLVVAAVVLLVTKKRMASAE